MALAGCGSVSSTKPDAATEQDAPAGGADATAIDATVATCAPTPPMLRARYRAESNANDHAGNFNGTAVGTNFSYAAGKFGQAFQLDGTDDIVTINDGDQMWPAGSLTLEAWFRTTAIKPSNVIVCKYACGAACPAPNQLAYFCLYTDASGRPTFDFRPDAQTTDNISVTKATLVTVNDGNWHHVVGVRDAAAMTVSVYVDGALATSANPIAAQFGPMTNADNEVDLVTIGGNVIGGQTTYEAYFAGAIDEVSIYHSALTPAQVAAIYGARDGKCL